MSIHDGFFVKQTGVVCGKMKYYNYQFEQPPTVEGEQAKTDAIEMNFAFI